MVLVTKDNQTWNIWNARVIMDTDPVSGLNILILAHLEIDNKRVADYGVSLSGEKASEFYANWNTHKQLYEQIFQDANISEEVPENVENEFIIIGSVHVPLIGKQVGNIPTPK